MTAIPEGYKQDPRGALIPLTAIKPIDLLRDEVVQEVVARVRAMSRELAALKTDVFQRIDDFVDLSAREFDVQLGGTKGNVSLRSFDGRYKVERAVAEYIVFDERLQVAKALIDECLREWTEGARTEIRALIDQAFQVDKEGRISTGRVLGLRRLNIADEKWEKAMQAINDAITVTGSKTYVRVYERVGNTERYLPIPLDIAAV